MKKFLSILVICTLVFHLFGYFAVFKVMQFNIKKQIKTTIKQGVPENVLHCFRFPTDKNLQKKMGIKWLEKKEFSYKGNMYDVVSKVVDGDFIIYKCVNDTQEKTLFAGLDKQVKNSMNKDSNKSKTLNLLLKFNVLYINQPKLQLNPDFYTSELTYHFKLKYFYNLSKEILTPPPQIS